MGVVYSVSMEGVDGLKALKTLQDRFLTNPASVKAFQNEALIWIKVGPHPNVVQAEGFLPEIDNRPFLVLEYVAPSSEGKHTFADYLEKEVPLETALDWGIQACRGMEHAFLRGLVCHRDIKPQNIMVTTDGVVKITDFGIAIANVEVERQQPGAPNGAPVATLVAGPAGTLGYIAPELRSGRAGCERSDVFSFGVVLYQLLTGSIASPLLGIEGQSWIQKDAAAARPIRSPLWPVIARCLLPSPADRISTFRRLRVELESLATRYGSAVSYASLPSEGPPSWVSHGLSLAFLGRYEEALLLLDRAIATEPGYTPAWTAKASTLRQAKRFDEALVCCDNLIRKDPHVSDAWGIRGQVLADMRRWPEAIESFTHAIELEPDPAAFYSLASLYRKLERWQDVVDCCDRGLQFNPVGSGYISKNLVVLKAESLSYLSRFAEALACCDVVLQTDLKDASAWAVKAFCLRSMNRSGEELESLRRFTQLRPQFAQGWRLLASAEAQAGNELGALTSKLRALQLEPTSESPDFIEQLGQAFEFLNRPSEAIEAYTLSLSMDRSRADTFVRKGLLLAKAGQSVDAIRCFESAVAIRPEHREALNNAAVLLLQLGRLEEAEQHFGRFLGIEPNSTNALLNLAYVAERKREFSKALEYVDRILRMNPKDDAALAEKGRIFFRSGDYDNAMAAYSAILVRDQNNVTALVGAGQSYTGLKLWDHALACYTAAIRLGANSVDLWMGLGIAAEGKGIIEGAIDSYHRAINRAVHEYSSPQLQTVLIELHKMLKEVQAKAPELRQN